LRNAFVFRLKRLRQPKYAMGALFGLAYFYFYFYRFLGGGGMNAHQRPLPGLQLGITPDLTLNLAALVLLVVTVAFAWLLPASRAALGFTEAELAWLLPAPLSRPALIRFKLLKSQIGLLLLAFFMTLLTGRFARDGHAWLHAGAWWVVFATLQLHRLGASFVLTRLMDRGLSHARRRLFVLAVMAGAVAVLLAWRQSAPQRPDLTTVFTNGHAGPYLRELVNSGPAPWLLAPFRWVVAPWFANDAFTFLAALCPALVIIALHYVWVIRSDVSFEEASIELSQKRAAFLAARRSGELRLSFAPRRKGTAVFALRPTGWAPVAFIWKSWIQAGGKVMLRRGLAIAALLIGIALILPLVPHGKPFAFLPGLAGFIACISVLFAAPQATAQMMRRELNGADWLKSVPVRGWEFVLGQLAGSSCCAAAIQVAGLVVIWTSGFAAADVPPAALRFAPVACLCAVFVLPAFNVLMSIVPTGVMLIFPGWFKPGEQRGIEATGLAMIMLLGQLIFMALALVAPALAFGGLMFALHFVAAEWFAILAGALCAAVVLVLEGGLGILVLGGVFDRFDASRE
jgi:hypothetical protein